jgi:hypothetical protein
VSNSALKKLEFLVGLVVACVLLWFACRLISRGLLRWFAHPLGAALLLVAGLAAMCGGVLPVVGGLAFVTGIGLLIAAAVRATIA